MAKAKVRIYDSSTGETIDRDMTADELAAWEADNAMVEAAKNASKQLRELKIAAYQKNGLTAEEIAAILG